MASVATRIGAVDSGVAGEAPSLSDVASVSAHDLAKILPVVMLVLALLLAFMLRSLVAPLYLVLSVALSYLAALGLAVLAFVIIGGQAGINFVLPFFMFIFIMALGEDYNILVMSRIREEAHTLSLPDAVRRAVQATGTTVTSAGLILAGTFAVLTATGGTAGQRDRPRAGGGRPARHVPGAHACWSLPPWCSSGAGTGGPRSCGAEDAVVSVGGEPPAVEEEPAPVP